MTPLETDWPQEVNEQLFLEKWCAADPVYILHVCEVVLQTDVVLTEHDASRAIVVGSVVDLLSSTGIISVTTLQWLK